MNALFFDWMCNRDIGTLLGLLENVDLLDPEAYNQLFHQMVSQIFKNPERMEALDWIGYIQASLRRAGFKGQDVDVFTHDIVVKLLVSPGKLFRGWDPKKHGPLNRRFKRSVLNATKNIVAKERNWKKRFSGMPPSELPAQDSSSEYTDEFRELVRRKLGKLGVAVLDWRLEAREVKDMVSRPEFGNPTAYQIKKIVKALKKLAREYGQLEPMV